LLRFMLTERIVSFSDIRDGCVGGGTGIGACDDLEAVIESFDYNVVTHGCGGRFDHVLMVFRREVVVMNDNTFLDWFRDGSRGDGVDISNRGGDGRNFDHWDRGAEGCAEWACVRA
jgi:hypothetical protein